MNHTIVTDLGTHVETIGDDSLAALRFQPPPAPQPLDRIGVIATLNAVLGVWTLTDAANAAGVTPQQLIDEAEGWAAGGNP